jgi:serine/threonine protein kinase
MKSVMSNNSFMEYKSEYSVLDGSVMHTSRLDISVDESGRKNVNQYAVQRTLGQGSFGKVKLVRSTITKQFYAAKIIDQKKLKVKFITMGLLDLANTESFQKEIAILKNLDHPNIVKLHEVIQDETRDEVYLVMDWVKKGAVMSKDYWKNELGLRRMKSSDIPVSLSVEKARKYFQGLASGIHYCMFFLIG